MITGADVRHARGKTSRREWSQLVGITEAKIAGIENGRAIRPDELEKLIQFVTPLDPTSPMAVTGTGSPPPRRPAPEDAPPPLPGRPLTTGRVVKRTPKPPKIPKNPNAPIAILEFETDMATPVYDYEFWTIVNVAPPDVHVDATPRQLVPPGSRLVSNSEVQTFKRCRRKWWLAFYRGLRPLAEKHSGALKIGTRAHLALAEWYQPEGMPQTDPRDALERILLDDWDKIQASTDDELKLADLAKTFKDEADLLRALLEGYMQWLEETGADEDIEVIAPEAPMAAQMPLSTADGTPVFITGRMDVRARRRSDGARLFIDHKTVADMTSPTRVLHMNPQMKHYHLLEVLDMERDHIEAGGELHFQVERTDGAIYNMLRKTKRTVRAKPPFYQRVEVRHNDHEIKSYERELRGVLGEMLRLEAQLAEGYDTTEVAYPTPNDTCTWSCDFFAVCPMFDDGSRAENFIENNYVEVDPYDRYPEFS